MRLRVLYTFLPESFKLAQLFRIQFCIINETTWIILEKWLFNISFKVRAHRNALEDRSYNMIFSP